MLSPSVSPGGTTPRAGGLLLQAGGVPDGGGDGGAVGGGGGNGDVGGGAQGRTGCIVFPATYASIARWPPSDAAKSGVIVFAG